MSRSRQAARHRRHRRVRKKVRGSAARPRLAVFRSNKHIYAQAIDDDAGCTVAAASDLETDLRGATGDPTEVARLVGKLVGDRLKASGISEVVFDRGGYRYHGRVAAVADGARDAGLSF